MTVDRARCRRTWAVLAAWLTVTAVAVSGCGDQQASAPRADAPLRAAILTHDGVLTFPDGRTVDTGITGGTNDVAVLEDGRVVVSGLTSPDADVVRVFGSDGKLESTYPRGPFEDMQATRSAVAWTDEDRRPHVLRSGASAPLALAIPPVANPDNDSGAFEMQRIDCDGPAADCAVVVHYDEVTFDLPPGYDGPVSLRVTARGSKELEPTEPDGLVVSTSRDGRVEAALDDDYCLDLREAHGGPTLGHTCDAGISTMVSPDGEHVVIVLGSDIVVHDRALKRLRSIPIPDDLMFLDQVWKNDDSLLMVFVDTDEVVPDPAPNGEVPGGKYEWSIVEVPIDGGKFTVRKGPVVAPHPDTNQWAFKLVEA
jgi:hypothetical protein